jgi:hypothetical protein
MTGHTNHDRARLDAGRERARSTLLQAIEIASDHREYVRVLFTALLKNDELAYEYVCQAYLNSEGRKSATSKRLMPRRGPVS